MKKETKSELAVLTGKEGVMGLLTLAVTEKVPVEILEKVMAMQDKYDAKIASEAISKAILNQQDNE